MKYREIVMSPGPSPWPEPKGEALPDTFAAAMGAEVARWDGEIGWNLLGYLQNSWFNGSLMVVSWDFEWDFEWEIWMGFTIWFQIDDMAGWKVDHRERGFSDKNLHS